MPALTTHLLEACDPGEYMLRVVVGPWPTDLGGYLFNMGPDREAIAAHW